MNITKEEIVSIIKEELDNVLSEQQPTIDEKWDVYLTRRNNVWRAAFIDRINGREMYSRRVAKMLKSGAVKVIESLYSRARKETYTDELQKMFERDSIPAYGDLAAFINELAETLYMEPLEGVLSLDKASPSKREDVHKAMARALEQSIQMIDPAPTASGEPESEISPEVRQAMSLLKRFDAETFFGDYAGEGSRYYKKWKRWADGGFSGKNRAVLALWPEPTTLVRIIQSMELGDKYTATIHSLVIESIDKEIEDAGGFGPWLNAIRGPLEVDPYGSGLKYRNEGFASYLREKVFAAMKERGVNRSFLTKLRNKLGGGQFREGKKAIVATLTEGFNKMPDELVNMINGLSGMEFEEGFETFINALDAMIADPSGGLVASNYALIEAAVLVERGMDNLQLNDLEEWYDLDEIIRDLSRGADDDDFMDARPNQQLAMEFSSLLMTLRGKVNKELAGMKNSDDNLDFVNQ